MSSPLQFNLIMIIIIGNKLSRNMLIIYVNKESKLTSSTKHDNIKEQITEKTATHSLLYLIFFFSAS